MSRENGMGFTNRMGIFIKNLALGEGEIDIDSFKRVVKFKFKKTVAPAIVDFYYKDYLLLKRCHNSVCPFCKGTGVYALPRKMVIDTTEIKRNITVELRKKGYSIRQIQVALGYKSPRSVHEIIKKNSL